MKRSLFIGLIWGLLVAFNASGQYIFDNLNVSDGLSYKSVLCIHKDREGFYWFGTANGLNRYDGSGFKVFNQAHQNVRGLLSDHIQALSEDAHGLLWIGTNEGVYTFDKAHQLFQKLSLTSADSALTVVNIKRDQQHRMWVFTQEKGIYLWNTTQQKLIRWNNQPDHLLISNRCVVTDTTRHGFWIATSQGIHFLDYQANQLYYHGHNPKRWTFLNNHPIISLTIDHQHNLWYGDLSDSLLYCRSLKGNTLRHWGLIQEHPRISLAAADKIVADSEGRIWISTYYFKSFVLEPNANTFQPVPYSMNSPHSFGYVYFYDAYEDEQGNVWFATFNGISKWRKNHLLEYVEQVPSFNAYVDVPFNSIFKILRLPNGESWIAKGDGLIWYKKGKMLARYVVSNNPEDNEITSVIQVGAGLWCLSSTKGVLQFKFKTRQFAPLRLPASMAKLTITKLFRDKSGMVWLHAFSDGLYRFDPLRHQWKHYPFKDDEVCMTMQEDREQNVLVVCGKSLWRYEKKYDIVRPLQADCLKGARLFQVAEDAQRRLWVGTSQGVYQIDTLGKCLYAFTSKQGLGMNRVEQVAFDQIGNLWIGTYGSLGYLNPQTKIYTPLDFKTRLPFHEYWSDFFQIEAGRFIIPVFDEILVINTNNMKQVIPLKKPLLTSLEVFETEKPFDPQKGVQLTYKQNYFTLHFSSPDHHDNPGLRYAYLLEGYDPKWTYCGRRQTAPYTNVPGGDYHFLVKVIDNQGRETSYTTLHISITPPFWAIWWFRLLVGIALLGLGWLALRQWKRYRQRDEIQQMIDYFTTSRYGLESVEEILWDITRNCISRLHFEDCVIYLLDEQRQVLVQKAAYGPKNPKEYEIVNPIEIPVGIGIVGTVAKTGQAELISDTSKDPRYIPDDQVRLSELAVPIVYHQKVIGVIDSEHSKRNFYTTDHLNALTTVATISATRIEEVKAKIEVAAKERKLLEFNKLLAESKLMVLRAQMNPHFIFNCLSSIQECVVSERYKEAYQYLRKFARLLRLVVQNTARNTVPLSEEIEMLTLYLDLEKLRFADGFSFAITCAEIIDQEDIEIPPMLLQPFVENALWHGLMPKPTERVLSIDFQLKDDAILVCSVDDNGIGRKQSFAQKQQRITATKHQSKGIQITEDRLRLLHFHQNQHAHIEIVDKENTQGEALGTTVRIELSVD
ncbi:MAG: two-component regulator propeller domain-containing protein [Spirosomataceae bacterium]